MATRINNPATQHFNKASPYAPLSGGRMFFYEPGGTTKKTTYSDDGITANANPVILDTAGFEPNIFGDGVYRIVLESSVADGSLQQWVRDPVDFSPTEGVFGDWDSTIDYGVAGTNIVLATNGFYYISIQTPNINQDPSTAAAYWTRFDLLKRWNTNETYAALDPVLALDGNIYTSIAGANLGNDPTATSGFWSLPIVTSNQVNYLINGDFPLWDYSTSFTATGYGGANRWRTDMVGSTFVGTQQTFTAGQTTVPDHPTFYSRTVVTSVANAANYVRQSQRLENVRLLSGQSITLSFYAKADSGKDIATECVQHFGGGGGASADVTTIGVTTHTLTSSWVKQTVTITVPSITGKTIDPAVADSYLEVIFWYDAGANFDARTGTLGQRSGTFEISHVQVEKGTVATNFKYRSIGAERELCQRYYEKSYNHSVAPASVSALGMASILLDAGTDISRISQPFKVTKRGLPTVTIYSPSTGTTPFMDTFGAVAAAGAFNVGESGFEARNLGTADQNIAFQWTAESEL